jgi:hypothetical protein
MTNGDQKSLEPISPAYLAELERCKAEGVITEIQFHEYKCETRIAEALQDFWKDTGCIPLVYVKAYGQEPGSTIGVAVKALE